jgi:hypothetical protein
MRSQGLFAGSKKTLLMAAAALLSAGLPGAAKADPIGGPIQHTDYVLAGHRDVYSGLFLDDQLTEVDVIAGEAPVVVRVIDADGQTVAEGVGTDVKLLVDDGGIYTLEVTSAVSQPYHIHAF